MKEFLDENDPSGAIRILNRLLYQLDFDANFPSFSWSGAIAAGAEQLIANRMPQGVKPTKFIVTYSEGTNQITAGPTKWDSQRVSLKNNGGVTATLTVYFFR